MSDAGLGAAGRRARPSVRRRDGERLSRAERPGDLIPVEGEPEADPDRAPTRSRVPQGKPPCRGGAAAPCRRRVACRGVGFAPPLPRAKQFPNQALQWLHAESAASRFAPDSLLEE